MIERQAPEMKFDIDRKDNEANVINKEISNRQDEIVKTKTDVRQETSHIFTMSNV